MCTTSTYETTDAPLLESVSSLCRVCLIGNISMQNVDDIHLLKMYELLTNTKLITESEDGMPNTICYFCHRQLQRCLGFFDKANKSNKILRELLHNDKTHTFTTQSLGITYNLMVAPMQSVSINICSNTSNVSSLTVKEEQVVVKEEETTENENIRDEALILETLDEDVAISDSNNTEPSGGMVNDLKTSSFYCDICNEKVNTKYLLKFHYKMKHGGMPYPCKSLKKEFTQKSDLTSHRRNPTGEKLYFCKWCSKAFTHKCDVIIHTRVHTGIKPYSCEICSMAFSQKSILTRHMQIHTGEKPYSCKTCHEAFRQKTHLTDHMRTHTGEKPYSCKRCSKAFTHKSALTRHMIIHTGIKPCSCRKLVKHSQEKLI